jgi:catechol 2,3-dioxygenase-like lactoylglutathione lyase family enzyme
VRRRAGALGIGAAVIVSLVARPSAQNAAPDTQAADVAGVASFVHLVGNLEKSISFYSDLLGVGPNAAVHPYFLNPRVATLYGIPGTEYRGATLRIPGSELACELQDWNVFERRSVHPRLQDPGATTLVLTVRSIETAVAAIRNDHAVIVTPGQMPVALAGENGAARALMINDPDGFHVELVQPSPLPPMPSSPAGNVMGVRLRMTVLDLAKTSAFYRDALGFAVGPDVMTMTEAAWERLAGVRARARIASTMAPGSQVPIELVEFIGIDRSPLRAAVHSPGVSMLRLHVRDIDRALKALRVAGAGIVSTNAQWVMTEMGQRSVIASEMNNIFLQAVELSPGPARNPIGAVPLDRMRSIQ